MIKKVFLFYTFALILCLWSEAQESRYKLLIFEGSDWCSNCMRFDQTIMQDDQVATFLLAQDIASEHIDFPQRKQLDEATKTYNASIAEKYNFKGLFPTILLIDSSNEKIFELYFQNQAPLTFINQIKSHLKIDE